jgi:hypothetical protein
MAALLSNEASVYNKFFYANNWQSPRRTLLATILSLGGAPHVLKELTPAAGTYSTGTATGYWFMHGRAPAHFAHDVRQFLDLHYPDRWMGGSGSVLWRLQSPSLTPADL